MFFNVRPFRVFRQVLPDGGWGSPEWHEIGVVRGTLSPISGSDEIRNSQEFSDVRNVITCDDVYMGIVQEQDELLGPRDRRYRVRLVMDYENVLPHVALYVANIQWEEGFRYGS